MPEVHDFTPGDPCWLDLGTPDIEAAKTFYSELFGWRFEDTGDEFNHYNMATVNGLTVAGAMPTQDPQESAAWGIYLRADDLDATQRTFGEGGGQILLEPIQVGARGHMMIGFDTTGTLIGAWQAEDFDGYEIYGQHGTPCRFELLTTDYEGSLAFYRDVFGWQTSVLSGTDEFRYSTLGKGEHATAGIMDAAGADLGSLWQVYFGVDDTDQALARVGELGGTVLRGPVDREFGRIAQLTDPSGAAFMIVSV